jgi:hypothetical protein
VSIRWQDFIVDVDVMYHIIDMIKSQVSSPAQAGWHFGSGTNEK